MSTIGFVGAGNMAEVLIKGIIGAKLYKPKDILISDVRKERLEQLSAEYGVMVASDNAELAGQVDVLVLSVKPQNMAEALGSIEDSFNKKALKVGKITDALGDIGVVRVMPNTPALIGQGASALFANEKAKPVMEKALDIFSAVGVAVVVEDEGLIDAVTAVSGSGPAYYFLLMEEMVKAAEQLGLGGKVAKELVLQMAKGAALLAVERDKAGESPAELRRKVTSPGGTTEAALKVFAEAKFSELVARALTAACRRSEELSG